MYHFMTLGEVLTGNSSLGVRDRFNGRCITTISLDRIDTEYQNEDDESYREWCDDQERTKQLPHEAIEQTRMRMKTLRASVSDIGFDRYEFAPSRWAGSAVACLKRQARRIERRMGRNIIQEQFV